MKSHVTIIDEPDEVLALYMLAEGCDAYVPSPSTFNWWAMFLHRRAQSQEAVLVGHAQRAVEALAVAVECFDRAGGVQAQAGAPDLVLAGQGHALNFSARVRRIARRDLLALEDGAPGDIIRLRNTKSFKGIRGRVIDSRIVQLGL